jgi:hypothetical protein
MTECNSCGEKTTNPKYCSLRCAANGKMATRIVRVCETCGVSFTIKRKQTGGRFCGAACRGWSPRGVAPADRFWSRVTKGDGCWEWSGARDRGGYGHFNGAHGNRAHRFSWILANGPIPAGMLICHRCDNPPCVNPDHLFLGTVLDNHRDMDAKGRRPTAANRMDLPTGEIVTRYISGESELALARAYSVTRAVIARRLREAGITRRSGSEASRLRMARMTPEERKDLARAANEAARGSRC